MERLTSNERTEILSQLSLDQFAPWRERIDAIGNVRKVKEPAISLVMMRAEDSVEGAIFNVGEILVSEAVMTVDDEIGYGMIIGNDLEKAEIIALIDAIFHASSDKWEKLCEEINEWMIEKKHWLHQQKLKEFEWTKRTSVKFNFL